MLIELIGRLPRGAQYQALQHCMFLALKSPRVATTNLTLSPPAVFHLTRYFVTVAMPFQSEALVARGPFSQGKWAIEPVTLRALRDDEVLVEMVASGICHTDLHCGNTDPEKNVPGVYYPRVLGHEGQCLRSLLLCLPNADRCV